VRIPVATYRLQINDDFTLLDACAAVPWLARLGISDLYLSPIFEARVGSTHGYDVVDPTRVRASVGGMDALRALASAAASRSMGIILDIVPNHMAASVENPWWRDVLTHGHRSAYAHYFDIDWGSPEQPVPLELPILGDQFDVLLERGEIAIDHERRELVYHETRLPLAPQTELSPDVDVAAVLQRQHYRPVFWRRASEHIGYRRFFDITDLAGVRVEDRAVFEATHRLVRDLAADGTITGLRIDHIDGLRDPELYLQQLREFVRGPGGEPVYTVVEKILERTERVPAEWQCEGTTGYEFLSMATGLLLEPAGHAALETLHDGITGDDRRFDELVREKKLLVMERLFGGELAALSRTFAGIAGISRDAATIAIAELTASMSVYRTYTRSRALRPEDRARIDEAHGDAAARVRAESERDTLDSLRRFVSLEDVGVDPAAQLDWTMRWQQFTGPVMAKGFEDTALYCHNALLAANDVGSDPVRPVMHAPELHAALATRAVVSPWSLNATATHDTKRGEDTRARIAVLAQMPGEWRARLRRWMRAGDEWQQELATADDVQTPSADVQSLLYQTLLGSWPTGDANGAYRARIKAYMTKAVREAKEQTSWRRPDEDYEEALARFIDGLMAEFGREGLADEVAAFAAQLAPHGAVNSLAQMLLKVTAPGIPDFYQGTELWSFTLVDPDNRHTVDFPAHARLFDAIAHFRDQPDGEALRMMLADWADGRIKLLLTAHALQFRARHRDVLERGAVVPLEIAGRQAAHVFAFARTLGERACIVALPRWTVLARMELGATGDAWADTVIRIPQALRRRWRNALTGTTCATGDSVPIAELFAAVPFALLGAADQSSP
jgi:(1->4)-alpha-D-glucan 1-alpha-D-glucosylmutase